MASYSYYDSAEDVIFTNFTDIFLTREVLDLAIAEIIDIARYMPRKVFVVVCWKGGKMETSIAAYFGEQVSQLLEHVLGIVRYDATNLLTRTVIRTVTAKRYLQDIN